jgi:hypothetical protein
MKRILASSVLMCCLLSLIGCDADKQPAERAYAQVESSVAPVREMLEKYAPEDYEQLNQLMDGMRSKLNTGDYEGVMQMKDQVMNQLVKASSAAGLKKNEVAHALSANWKAMTATVPGQIEQVTDRVNALLSAPKLPAGISRDTVVRSQAIVAQLSGQWNAAMASAQRSAFDDAVKQGQEVKKRCADVATALNLKLSEG